MGAEVFRPPKQTQQYAPHRQVHFGGSGSFFSLLQVVYWDAYDGSAIRELEGALTGAINAMDMSQSGSHFVTGTGLRSASFHRLIGIHSLTLGLIAVLKSSFPFVYRPRRR